MSEDPVLKELEKGLKIEKPKEKKADPELKEMIRENLKAFKEVVEEDGAAATGRMRPQDLQAAMKQAMEMLKEGGLSEILAAAAGKKGGGEIREHPKAERIEGRPTEPGPVRIMDLWINSKGSIQIWLTNGDRLHLNDTDTKILVLFIWGLQKRGGYDHKTNRGPFFESRSHRVPRGLRKKYSLDVNGDYTEESLDKLGLSP